MEIAAVTALLGLFATVCSIVLPLLVLGALGVFLYRRSQQAGVARQAAQSWLSTTGQVLASSVQVSRSANSRTERPVVVYQYQVNGQTYQGQVIRAGDQFAAARWDLLPTGRYMWASVQTVRGCPKHCSFCSVWRTDGQEPRPRGVERVIREIVELRRTGFRFIALADDNFYPVTLSDLAQAKRRADHSRLRELSLNSRNLGQGRLRKNP